jgi:hypothetical protein
MATKKTKKTEEKTVPVAKVQEIAEQAAKEQAPQAGQIQVNVDFLKTTKVHIAMPCYGGMLTESTFMSFIKWATQPVNLVLTGHWKQWLMKVLSVVPVIH